MELNMVSTGIELIGTTVSVLNVNNNIVDVERNAKRSFGLNINEPKMEKEDDTFFAQMTIDFEVEIEQSKGRKCTIELSLEGAFASTQDIGEEDFEQLVIMNGAAAIIGIARGKIETISANIFNNGKIVIPFVNVADYYKSLVD